MELELRQSVVGAGNRIVSVLPGEGVSGSVPFTPISWSSQSSLHSLGGGQTRRVGMQFLVFPLPHPPFTSCFSDFSELLTLTRFRGAGSLFLPNLASEPQLPLPTGSALTIFTLLVRKALGEPEVQR